MGKKKGGKAKKGGDEMEEQTKLVGKLCSTPSCKKAATLRCPKCVKHGVVGTFFCSQSCFNSSWATHKEIHKLRAHVKEEEICSRGAIEQDAGRSESSS